MDEQLILCVSELGLLRSGQRSAQIALYLKGCAEHSSDGKFGSFYWLGPLSLVQQNEQIFFRAISFILAKYN